MIVALVTVLVVVYLIGIPVAAGLSVRFWHTEYGDAWFGGCLWPIWPICYLGYLVCYLPACALFRRVAYKKKRKKDLPKATLISLLCLFCFLALPACVGPAPEPPVAATVGDHCRVLYGAYCDSSARCSTSEHDRDFCVSFFVEQACCAGEACSAPSTLEEADVEACVEDFETRSCSAGIAEDSVCYRVMEL